MSEIYAAWPEKNDSLRTIFYHARFQVDLGYPLNPSTYDSSHKIMQESDDSTVEVTWSGAIDYSGDIAGYSIVWDGEPDTVPDDSIDTVMARSKSPALTEGLWYLHIRAVNVDGNAANGSYNIGPFVIAANATAQDDDGGSLTLEGWEIALLGVFAIVVAASVIGVSRIIKRAGPGHTADGGAAVWRAMGPHDIHCDEHQLCPPTTAAAPCRGAPAAGEP